MLSVSCLLFIYNNFLLLISCMSLSGNESVNIGFVISFIWLKIKNWVQKECKNNDCYIYEVPKKL